MAAINKSFVIKNGLEVNNNLIFADIVTDKVGIGTTNPQYTLHVSGGIGVTNLYVSGIATITTGIVTNLTSTNLNVTGIGTIVTGNITNLTNTNLNVTGIATIATLNATGIGVTNFTVYNNLSVGGISTFTNGPVLIGSGTSTGTASQTLQVTGGAYVSGNTGIGSTNPTSKLDVIGNVRVTGVITATTLVGSLTGTASSTTNIPNLTGAITSNNTTTSLGSFSSSDLATALTDETGSGANVFATSPTLVTPVLGSATATSVVVGSGVTINTSGINASGVVTATTFIGNVNAGVGTITTFNSTNGTITNLIGTAATIGTVKIVSGIITATSGVVTYYGDGTYLTGTASSPNLQAVLNTGNTSSTGFSITGVSTLTTLNSTSGTITNISGTNLNYSGIGTITNLSGVAINISGIATAQDFDALSDENYKENVITVNNALNKVEQLRGVSFDWKENGRSSYGVIAQELQKILPELVHGDNPKTVNYNGIIGVLIEAIKELKKEVEELKNLIV